MTQDEWVKLNGAENIMASETEKQAHVVGDSGDDSRAVAPDLMWHATEELIAPHVHRHRRSILQGYVKQSWLFSLCKALLFIAPLSLAAQLISDALGRLRNSAKPGVASGNAGRDFFV